MGACHYKASEACKITFRVLISNADSLVVVHHDSQKINKIYWATFSMIQYNNHLLMPC